MNSYTYVEIENGNRNRALSELRRVCDTAEAVILLAQLGISAPIKHLSFRPTVYRPETCSHWATQHTRQVRILVNGPSSGRQKISEWSWVRSTCNVFVHTTYSISRCSLIFVWSAWRHSGILAGSESTISRIRVQIVHVGDRLRLYRQMASSFIIGNRACII